MMTTGRICVSETNNIGKPPLTKYYRRDAGMQNYCLALLVAAIWTAEAEQAMTGVMNMVSTIIRFGLCLPRFYGKQKIVTSSSIRGQYSYSWASGNRPGSIYGISLREAISEILNPASSLEPTWENALSLAQRKTLYYTDQKQKPQYAIHVNRQQPTTSSQKHKVSPPSGKPIYVKIFSTTLQKDVNIGEYLVRLSTSISISKTFQQMEAEWLHSLKVRKALESKIQTVVSVLLAEKYAFQRSSVPDNPILHSEISNSQYRWRNCI